MFHVGDKIFYPMHGAGVVEAVEEKEFLGEKQLYYVLNMLQKGLNIMVPVEKMSELGTRLIVAADILDEVLAVMQAERPDSTLNAAQRYKQNTEKMKSGDIYEQAEVIRDLWRISQGRILGTSDKLMLDNAQQMMVGEIALVNDVDIERAAQVLRHALSEEPLAEPGAAVSNMHAG
ncbi:CarD family transcriptional regulator [Brevibacillus sp. SAFN-007a]|uniref:CarD family transcriptional regulator n=1 Tax=Brevibacillus sp. SAFN-007a TaxID=3436862 RepID=UPI003F7CDFB9